MYFTDLISRPDAKALFEFWLEKRGSRLLPTRRDIDPTGIPPHILPNLFLYRREDDRRFRCALAGTGIVRIDGCDATGHMLDDVHSRFGGDNLPALFYEVARTALPIYCAGESQGANDTRRQFWRILLPVGDVGASVEYIFGLFGISSIKGQSMGWSSRSQGATTLEVLRALPTEFPGPAGLHRFG